MDAAERYLPYEVYKNLKDFLEYRNVIDHDYKAMSEAEIMNQMLYSDFIKIRGTRDDKHGKRPFVIILIAPGSKVALNTPNFKKLINGIPAADLNARAEIVIISEAELTNFIMTQIRADKEAHPGLYIEHYKYLMFAIVMPKCDIIPVHTIVSDQEVEELCKSTYIRKDRLPSIYANDTGVVWIGARPGDVVRVERKSEAVGKAIGYRIVVKVPG